MEVPSLDTGGGYANHLILARPAPTDFSPSRSAHPRPFWRTANSHMRRSDKVDKPRHCSVRPKPRRRGGRRQSYLLRNSVVKQHLTRWRACLEVRPEGQELGHLGSMVAAIT